jgi:hypothetical protein
VAKTIGVHIVRSRLHVTYHQGTHAPSASSTVAEDALNGVVQSAATANRRPRLNVSRERAQDV